MKALLIPVVAVLALLPAEAATVLVDLQQGAIHTLVTKLDSGKFEYQYTFDHDQVTGFSAWFDDSRQPPTLFNVTGAAYTSSYDPQAGSMDFLRWWGQETIAQIKFESDLAPEATGQARLTYMGFLGDFPDRFPTLDIERNFNIPSLPAVPEPTPSVLFSIASLRLLTRRHRK